MTIAQIKQHLDTLEHEYVEFDDMPNACVVSFSTNHYKDLDGDHLLCIIVKIDPGGDYLEVFTPEVMSTEGCRYKAALFSAMLQAAFQTVHVQVEHDPSTTNFRFAIDYPVFDSHFTAAQLERMIGTLFLFAEQYYPVFRLAADTGKIDMSKTGAPT
ncbi:MAG: hypothetical protein ACO3QC_11040 [Phycisphaerales bacterium]